uniref:Uncharacterized protein n=1 Tax=Fagus sylvatica TaxID=28930 RepID=A0A2N9EEH1_FAGSY
MNHQRDPRTPAGIKVVASSSNPGLDHRTTLNPHAAPKSVRDRMWVHTMPLPRTTQEAWRQQ